MEELERGALGLLQGGPGAEVVAAGGGEGGGEGDEVEDVVDGVGKWGLVRHGFGFGGWVVDGNWEVGRRSNWRV